ncbi:MAG: hypothetical protein FWB94_09995 [Chitinispirillia bacterium]|nr:hypothetical protein [Chitinispirillia bacterium]
MDATDIKNLLVKIDDSFKEESDNHKAWLWAKMATLEASGWAEECIEDLLTSCIDQLGLRRKQQLLDKIKKNHGFHYSANFKDICVQILGNIIFEKIEDKIPNECQHLESALNELKTNRDRCAHTHVLNAGSTEAPHISLSYLEKIDIGLKKFMDELGKMEIFQET